MTDSKGLTRREFVKTAANTAAATSMLSSSFSWSSDSTRRRRYAIVGTGDRGSGMWGRALVERYSDVLEFVGLCDTNPKRAAASKELIGVNCPTFTNFDEMCPTRPSPTC
jgi:hypothetical protein